MSTATSTLVQALLAGPRWAESSRPLEAELHELGAEPICHHAAATLPFTAAPVGTPWGRCWDTTWFRLTGAVPPEWAGGRVVARLDLGWPDEHPGFSLEGLVWRDGQPLRGVCRFHEEVVLLRQARGGEPVRLLLEAAANPGPFPGAPTGVQLHGDRLGELRRADLVLVDPIARRLRRLLELGLEVVAEGDGPDRERFEQALTTACSELEAGGTTAAGVQALAPLFNGAAAPGQVLHAVANSHLDTAWLWPTRETRRKAARTLSTALEIAEDHPGQVFALSQPQQLAWLEHDHPDLFAQVQAAVATGQVELVGASWVEPDTNLPAGESLVRQLTVGARFLRDRFDVTVDGLWLPDVFGYSGQLPQLIRRAGMSWFMTAKLGMNDTNPFPHRTFWWEGIDGSRVLAHLPPADTYNGTTEVEEVVRAARVPEDTAGHALYLYGYGDGGGGPTREMVERIELMQGCAALPVIRQGRVGDFFLALERDARELPVWVGELYFELHRGTYTSQARTKAWHRRVEEALREADLWAAASGRSDPALLESLWRDLLLQQFHDILPGSSIRWVHDEAVATLQRVVSDGSTFAADCLGALIVGSDGATVVNTIASERAEVTVVPSVTGVAGQPLGDGRTAVWLGSPGLGLSAAGSGALPPDVPPVRLDGVAFDNGLLRVEWDPLTGHLSSVQDLRTGREVLAGPGNVLQLHEDQPRYWDAWDVERRDLDAPTSLEVVDRIDVLAAGPLMASLRVTRGHGASTYTQTVSLHAGSGLVRCDLEIDWHERHRLLKVAFPVAVRAASASYEIQFGHLQRPTHRNTSWDRARFEVCAQRWADLSEGGFGVALLNTNKNGYDVHGSVLRLSLLRASTWPDPDADQGRHEVTWALLPHAGDLVDADVPGAARAFHRPLRLAAGRPVDPVVLVSSSDSGVVVETVKPADDGAGIVVRLYEAHGGQRRSLLRFGLPVSAVVPVDLHERPIAPPVPMTGEGFPVKLAAFEVMTLRLVP
ncbi:MAG: alpha-mannosidase [Frankiaceae bacterium]|nr:alpha-mannosidase [Frankiaceae bacterium]